MFEVFDKPCKNCLLSEERIVSPEAAQAIIDECKQKETYFICHKASMNGTATCCHAYFKQYGGHAIQIRLASVMQAIQFIPQPDDERLPSYKELENL